MKIRVELRKLLVHLLPHVRNHFLDASVPLRFQFHRYVARIRFRYRRQPKLQTCAARCTFHFRDRVKDVFDRNQYAIRVCERRARRHQVIEDETTFIHGGKQVAAERAIAEERAHDQCQAQHHQDQRTGQSRLDRTLVNASEASHNSGTGDFMFGPLAAPAATPVSRAISAADGSAPASS